jgi:ABC-type bacteriocin/lantibiotic exporter with double-glycine peptidase domain
MIREYPDVRQSGDYDCGSAVIDGLFKFLGARTCANVAMMGLATESDGLHPSTIEAVLRRAGLRIQSGTMTIADLKHHTAQNRPVLCPIDVYGGHWVTVLGVGSKRVHYHCPTRGLCSESHESWKANWRDSTRAGHAFDTWGIAVS